MGKGHQNLSKKQQKTEKKQGKQGRPPKNKPRQGQEKQQSESSENADIDLNQLEKQQTEQLQVGFIIGEIQQSYYHSLKTILLRYAQITKTTNSELADALIQNRTIGNVILADDFQEEGDDKQEEKEDEQSLQDDEENVYSVLSVFSGKINISQRIRSFVLKNIEKKGFPEEIISILNEANTAVILNERLANLPAFVVNSAHEVFKKDMEDLRTKNPKKYEQLYSGYLLNISQIQFEGEQDLQKLIYSKFQDFQMCKRSRVWWVGDKNSSFKKKADMRNLYYLVKAEQFFKGIDQIKTYLEQ